MKHVNFTDRRDQVNISKDTVAIGLIEAELTESLLNKVMDIIVFDFPIDH